MYQPAAERIHSAIDGINLLMAPAQGLSAPAKRIAQRARYDLYVALDMPEAMIETICIDPIDIEALIEQAGIEYRKAVFM